MLVIHWKINEKGVPHPDADFCKIDSDDEFARYCLDKALAHRLHISTWQEMYNSMLSDVLRILQSERWAQITEDTTFMHYLAQLALLHHEKRKQRELNLGEAA